MHARLNPFPRLRRRARAVLGPVLPVLALAWVGAAGPCVGMAAAPPGTAAAAGEAASGGRADAASAAEAHAAGAGQTHDAHAGHARPAGHGGHADGPAQADGPAHAGAPAPAAHAHGACPHCPAPADAAGEPHAQCGALDDVSDAKRDSPLTKLDLKVAAPAFAGDARVPDPGLAAARRLDADYRAFPSRVPLHLRHCVLIV